MYSTVCRRETAVKVQTVHFRFVALQRRLVYDNVIIRRIYTLNIICMETSMSTKGKEIARKRQDDEILM